MQYIKTKSVTIQNITTNNLESIAAQKVAAAYPFRLTPYYASLIGRKNDAIWRQCVPDQHELDDYGQIPDPLAENALSPVPGLIHRYPDRVVLLVSNRCAVYCRFCMRKRHVGEGDAPPSNDVFERALAYIRATPAIRDVILSGGDPLMLDDESLDYVLSRLREISHVAIIRIGTRMPLTMPERVTSDLCQMLRKYHPLYINTHFNHPTEITPESSSACQMLADAGIPLGNQTVLLRGVNDSADIMCQLMTALLTIRVRPYYIHQMDLVKGTAHFRTSVSTGLEIVRGLRGHVSGLAVPHYVIDLPEGKGKVPILPDTVERHGNTLLLTTYHGERISYSDLPPTAPLE